jgi:hypothetical protein
MGPLATTGTFSKVQKLIEVEDKAILPTAKRRVEEMASRWEMGERIVLYYGKWLVLVLLVLLVQDSRLSGGPLRIWEDNDLWQQGLTAHAKAV